ncbi:MAG: glycosyltransferase family 2 protein [Methylococcales bacterium]|nr:glycosyltransferase family 2 protein [Methylococcales bacterium]
MSLTPLVSVLIPVYNAGSYLVEAVESIINQTYSNLEIIIVNDGSTDGCIATLKNLQDRRIRILHQDNQGKAAALNHAFEQLKGTYFVIQDADDRSYPERIEQQLACMQKYPELAAVYIRHDLILNDKQFAPNFAQTSAEECEALIDVFKIPAHDATGMYKMSFIGDMRFDKSLRIGQGVDFVLRVGEKYPIMCLGACLYTYRINYNSTIRQDVNKNNLSVNVIRQKACERRQLNFELYRIRFSKSSAFFKHREGDTHIIPHCMESVMSLKDRHQWLKAFSVGWQCCRLHPLDGYYYKPLFYAFIPNSLIENYRNYKKNC